MLKKGVQLFRVVTPNKMSVRFFLASLYIYVIISTSPLSIVRTRQFFQYFLQPREEEVVVPKVGPLELPLMILWHLKNEKIEINLDKKFPKVLETLFCCCLIANRFSDETTTTKTIFFKHFRKFLI